MTEKPVVYQQRGLRYGVVLAGLIQLIVTGSLLFSEEGLNPVLDVSLFVLALLLLVFYVARLSRIGLYAYESRAVIKNPIRTTELEWKDIREFAFARSDLTTKLEARLRSGETVPISGLTYQLLSRKQERQVQELSDRVTDAQT